MYEMLVVGLLGFIIFAIIAGICITNSHIDRVEERLKKLIESELKPYHKE